MACKQCDVVRSLEEICRGICPSKDVKSKTKLAARYYRTMVMEMGQVHAPSRNYGQIHLKDSKCDANRSQS